MNISDLKAISSEDDFLYSQIADRLGRQIQKGTLKSGDKLPSLRALSKEQGISLSTAFKAYIDLENKGFIEARPKSGYYVRFSKTENLSEKVPVQSEPGSEKKDVNEMIMAVNKSLTANGVIRLSIASPSADLLPRAKLNKSMLEVLRTDPANCTQYDEIQGNRKLRQQVAKYAFNWNGNISENDVITTQGCMEALVFCLKAVAKPGDTIAIESPGYFGIFSVIKSLGLNVREIPVHPLHGIDLNFLESVMDNEPIKACLFVPNFCNPTACFMSDESKSKLVDILFKRNIPLIEDDIYGEMYFGKQRPRTCKSFDKHGMVLLCSSVSKTLAPGYRVGWCIPGKFIDQVTTIKLQHSISSATPTQAAIANFFETGRYDLHMRKLRKTLHTQSLRYIQAVAEHFPKDTKISRPQGGYVLWIELNPTVNAYELFEKAVLQKITFAPGQIFSIDGRFTNFARISFGTPFNEEINIGLKKLGELVKSMIRG